MIHRYAGPVALSGQVFETLGREIVAGTRPAGCVLRPEPHAQPPTGYPVLLHMLVAAAINSGDAPAAESAMRQIVAEVQSVVSPGAAAGGSAGAPRG